MSQLITSVTDFESLVKAIRSGNACIAITQLSGGKAGVPNPCFGALIVNGDMCEIRLRSVEEEGIKLHAGIFANGGDKKLLDFQCVLDGHLEVGFKGAWAGNTNMIFASGVQINYGFNEIVCADKEVTDSIATEIQMVSKIARSELRYKNQTITTQTECSLEGEMGHSWKTESLAGDIPPYRYKIRQDKEDLELSLKLLDGYESLSAESDSLFMSAMILSFVWINGGHPYAYYRTHQRNGIQVEGVLQRLINNSQCKARLIASFNDGSVAAKIMESSINFFRAETPFSKDLRLFLWQYRDATAADTITVGMLLQACTLLEGLVGITLRHPLQLSKSKIEKLMMPGKTDKRGGTGEARFNRAGVHLGFDWDTELYPVFTTWKNVRDALAHGNLAEFEKISSGSVIDSYRQIIQAFNAITLRLIGFKGSVLMNKGWFAAGG